MKSKEITIENFKGINFLNIVVGEKGLLLEGENRTHKTTVLSSILWVLTDKDYDLTNSHDLFPDDGRAISQAQTRTVQIIGKITVTNKIAPTIVQNHIS